MSLTDKQIAILNKEGYTDEEIAEMPYEEASDLIGQILSRPRFQKALKQPKTDFVVYRPNKTALRQKVSYENGDKKSYYVAYAKDLCIAMLQAHVEARKIDSKLQPLEVETLMKEAIRLITLARHHNF